MESYNNIICAAIIPCYVPCVRILPFDVCITLFDVGILPFDVGIIPFDVGILPFNITSHRLFKLNHTAIHQPNTIGSLTKCSPYSILKKTILHHY